MVGWREGLWAWGPETVSRGTEDAGGGPMPRGTFSGLCSSHLPSPVTQPQAHCLPAV